MNDAPNADVLQAMDYHSYLMLDTIYGALRSFSGARYEEAFIRVHQACELAFEDTNRYLRAAKQSLRQDRPTEASRFLRIVVSNIRNWWVVPLERLREMRPNEFHALRPFLGSASGFQSCGYREYEFHLGLKNLGKIAALRSHPEVYQRLLAVYHEPSLWDEATALLARRGFAINTRALNERDAGGYQLNDMLIQTWLAIYREPDAYLDLYDLGEDMLEIDQETQFWRFRHLKTVQRMIGRLPGTAGTDGAGYLTRFVETEFCPELWAMRGQLGR